MIRFSFFKQARRDERGVALTAALGVSTILALAGTTVVAFTSTNYGTASRSKADQAAFVLAEAGINNAAAVLHNASDPTNASLLSKQTTAYDGGTVTWWGTYDLSASTWTVTAIGEVRNPTGPAAAPVRRTVSAKIPVNSAAATLTQPLSNQAWNYVVATRTGNACDETLSSGVTWSARLYVMGNLCFSSAATVNAGPLAVRGLVNLANSDNYIGSSSAPVNEVHAGGGCKYTNKSTHVPCSSADHVYATVSDASPPALTPPTPDWDGWYKAASPGPLSPCTSSTGAVPAFDNDGVRNNSVTAVFDLTPASSYSCSTASGQLAWDATTRVLTVSGTIFVDGNAKAGNGLVDTYVGQGVLYLSGAFEISANTRLCAVAVAGDCDFASWVPNTALLGIVANGNGGGNVFLGYSIQVSSYARFQGAFFGTYGISFGSSSKAQGPLIASFIAPCSSMQLPAFPLLATVPAGLPGQPLSSKKPGAPTAFNG